MFDRLATSPGGQVLHVIHAMQYAAGTFTPLCRWSEHWPTTWADQVAVDDLDTDGRRPCLRCVKSVEWRVARVTRELAQLRRALPSAR